MNGYSTRNYLLKNTTQSISGVVTSQPVSSEFNMSAEDSMHFVVRVTATTVTVVGSITAKVQENWGDAIGWHDVGSEGNATISADGTVEIRMLIEDSSDQAQLPVGPKCRVVVTTTNAGDIVDITEVQVSRRF